MGPADGCETRMLFNEACKYFEWSSGLENVDKP